MKGGYGKEPRKLPLEDWQAKRRSVVVLVEIRGNSLTVVSWVNGTRRCGRKHSGNMREAQNKGVAVVGRVHPPGQDRIIGQTHLQDALPAARRLAQTQALGRRRERERERERRLMETRVAVNEIFEDRRADCWPIDLSDVQAEMWLQLF